MEEEKGAETEALASTEKVLNFVALVLAAAPAVIMAWYVTSRAGENFGDDYVHYLKGLARIWNHGISFEAIAQGALVGSHFVALPLLFRAAAMKLGHWDAFLESYVVLAAGVIRVWLIYEIFRTVLPFLFQRLMMLVVASFLVFAPVQLGLYAYGDNGLTIGMDHLGFLLGLWGAMVFPRSWRGVVLMAVGGLISSWTWGAGVAWGIFFVVALNLRFSWSHLIALAFACALIHVPHVKFADKLTGRLTYDLFNYEFIVGALGRPLVSHVTNIGDYPYANFVGLTGLVLSLVFAVRITRQVISEQRIPTGAVPGTALILYALVYLYQISLVRTGIGAWYVALSVNFWIGLIGLVLATIELPVVRRSERFASFIFGAVVLTLIAMLYVPANRSFEEKTPFLKARTFSSESCIRHYRSAPTFCEMLVFFWPPRYQFAAFSRFFEETQLASFGERQTWTLQGDWVLKTVSLEENPDRAPIQWMEQHDYRENPPPANWQSHNRLGLSIPGGQRVSWTLTLPATTRKAAFRTIGHFLGAGETTFTIVAQQSGRPDREILKQRIVSGSKVPISIDLSPYAGQPVTLALSADTLKLDGGPILAYPRVEITQKRAPAIKVSPLSYDFQGTPENTELAPEDPAQNTPKDIVLSGEKQVAWHQMHGNNLRPAAGHTCAGNYKALKISMNMPENITIRMVYVTVGTRKFNGNYEETRVQLPLLKDGGLHTYAIDTKLIPFDKKNKIETIRISSLSSGSKAAEQQTLVDIPEVRLVQNGLEKSFCKW